MISFQCFSSLENRTGTRRRSPADSHNEIIAGGRYMQVLKLTI